MFSFNSEKEISKQLIKLSAYDALLNSKVSVLPVDIFQIFKTREDVLLYDSKLFQTYDNWDKQTYTWVFGQYGTLIYDKEINKYYAFYNDFNSEPVIRWELTCLLALLELNLASVDYAIQIYCNDGDYTETFSYYFTAPDAILNEIGINSAEEIMESCNIPFDKARKKSRYLKKSWIDKKTYLEKILKSNFYDFIHLHKE